MDEAASPVAPEGTLPPPQALPPLSRRLAWLGFLALVTALLLPWWAVSWDADGTPIRDAVRPWRPEPPLTTMWGPWLTAALAVVAGFLLFLRIAAHSDKHEPATWRRDLSIAAVLAAAAVLSCLLWPAGVPSFWGGRTYVAENVTTEVRETTMPVLGWWLALAAALLVGAAAWAARGRGDDGVGVPATEK